MSNLDTSGVHTCSYYCNRPECIRAQRDELRAHMNWIDVNDDLPAPETDVLVCVNAHPGHIRTAYRTEKGEWFAFGSRSDGNPITPTHWQPLPLPPNA